MNHPNWKPIWKQELATDYQVFVDLSGTYVPEMEVYQEIGENRFKVYRFSLDKLKIVNDQENSSKTYLIPDEYTISWPHRKDTYEVWFAQGLETVAKNINIELTEFVEALTSDDVNERAWAYDEIGKHYGFNNLDDYPLELSADELEDRYKFLHESTN